MDNVDSLAAWANIVVVPLTIVSILVAILVPMWVYYRSRQKKSLSYHISDVWAIDLENTDFEVGYRGQLFKNVVIIRTVLKNTGNLTIRESDILEPIVFTFGPEIEILGRPRVISKKPQNLKASWSFGEADLNTRAKSVSLDFSLLNPNEELEVDFLVTGKSPQPKAEARIEGISEIKQVNTLKDFSLESRLRSGIEINILTGVILLSVLSGVLIWVRPSFVEKLIELIGELSISEFLAAAFLTGVFTGICSMVIISILIPLYTLIQYRKDKLEESEKYT